MQFYCVMSVPVLLLKGREINLYGQHQQLIKLYYKVGSYGKIEAQWCEEGRELYTP